LADFLANAIVFYTHELTNKKENLAVFNWQIFVIRQTTKVNSMPNFHLIRYVVTEFTLDSE